MGLIRKKNIDEYFHLFQVLLQIYTLRSAFIYNIKNVHILLDIGFLIIAFNIHLSLKA